MENASPLTKLRVSIICFFENKSGHGCQEWLDYYNFQNIFNKFINHQFSYNLNCHINK